MSISTVAPGKTKLGWIWTGVMSASTVDRRWSGGIKATVSNLHRAKSDGEDDRSPGGTGGRPAHEDGQPDSDRFRDDRRLRGTALRLQGGARSADCAQLRRQRGGRELVALEPGPANHEQQLRSRLF